MNKTQRRGILSSALETAKPLKKSCKTAKPQKKNYQNRKPLSKPSKLFN